MGQWLERYRGAIFFAFVVLAIAGIILIQILRPEPAPILLTTATPISSPEATPTSRPLRVYVSGAVNQPDVYTLPADSIVKDALLAAGGAKDEADLDRINLALPVTDGQHVYVPRLGEETPQSSPHLSNRLQPKRSISTQQTRQHSRRCPVSGRTSHSASSTTAGLTVHSNGSRMS